MLADKLEGMLSHRLSVTTNGHPWALTKKGEKTNHH